jgi:hypothetical protein
VTVGEWMMAVDVKRDLVMTRLSPHTERSSDAFTWFRREVA